MLVSTAGRTLTSLCRSSRQTPALIRSRHLQFNNNAARPTAAAAIPQSRSLSMRSRHGRDEHKQQQAAESSYGQGANELLMESNSAGPFALFAALAAVVGAAFSLHSADADAESEASKVNPPDDVDPHTKLPVEEAVLTFAPNVPPPITRRHPVKLVVKMTSDVVVAPVSNKLKYQFWTFNGKVPGPFIRARVGDVIEVHHTNNDKSGMPHNIDFHAVSGPGGGAAVTLVEMDETKKASFKLLNPGLYVYHCAAAPVPVHIANGMYGLILVEPEQGLPKVDKEFYVMQSEFYFDAPEGDKNTVEECSYINGLREQPEMVVFNGREGSLTQGEILKAKVNERVRIFFGNGGPNLISSFHVIGAIFDKVYRDSDFLSPPARNVQIALTPPGGSNTVEFTCPTPGIHTLVDHSIFRLDKGAVGFLNISGPPNPGVYHHSKPIKNCEGCKLHA